MTRYEPRYGERLCLVCGRWRGEHIGSDLGPNDELLCPVDTSYYGTTASFVPQSAYKTWLESGR